MENEICILSGLVIPKGKLSKEHFLPKSVCPPEIYSLPDNIFPAIKCFNWVKGNLYPCEWMSQRYDLCFKALGWNIRRDDKKLIKRALANGMPEFNPCDLCVARVYREWCKKYIEKVK